MAREKELADAFVDLADTLVGDFDVADLLYRLVEHSVHLLDVAQAGLLLSDQRGRLQLMASSSEKTKLLELFQLQADEGPCMESYRTGSQVAVADLDQVAKRWPSFVPAALGHGYRAVHAFPLRLRQNIIGALNLFNTEPGDLAEDDRHVAQALADTATIGIIQERAIARSEIVVEQLEGALRSRVVIEQAKGVLAERETLSMDAAFALLRTHARNTGTRLTELAHQVVTGTVLIHQPAARSSQSAINGPASRAKPGPPERTDR
jgi:GAF domain-containing protein